MVNNQVIIALLNNECKLAILFMLLGTAVEPVLARKLDLKNGDCLRIPVCQFISERFINGLIILQCVI